MISGLITEPPTPPLPPSGETAQIVVGRMSTPQPYNSQTVPAYTPILTYNNPVGAEISIDLHDFNALYPNDYVIIIYPATEITKTRWRDSGAIYNQGDIPDNVFNVPFINNGLKYQTTKEKLIVDTSPSSLLILSHDPSL